MKRRDLLVAAGVAAAGAWWWGGRRDLGGQHSPYFTGLGGALDAAGLARPTLVIDLPALRANIDVLMGHLGQDYDYRIVAKSLPSLPLLQAVRERSGSDRLMAFHQPFLNLLARNMPDSELLLGKPLPVSAAHRFYRHHSGDFDPGRQLQWLLDSPQRVTQYGELASQLQLDMQVNLELDVGLHRGGLEDDAGLVEALRLVEQHPRLQFSGFMGYEPHVAKMPGLLGGPQGAFERAQRRYAHFVDVAEAELGRSVRDLTLNAAGSPTYQRYNGSQVATELAAGSALVKPGDFDLDSLTDHRPAAWIATPVLKSMPLTRVPGLESVARFNAWLNPNREQAFFIYGGYWKASPESPPGLLNNSLYGRSTNQEMLNGSASIDLRPDDWVFLRPSQSEHVFLQFGDIAVFDGQQISASWPVFTQGA